MFQSILDYLRNKLQVFMVKTLFVTNQIFKKFKDPETPPSFTYLSEFKLGRINYEKGGVKHKFYFPYNPIKAFDMSQFQVELIKGDTSLDITQQLGAPYCLSAKQMGGEKFIVTDKLTNNMKVEMVEPPMFFESFFLNCQDD